MGHSFIRSLASAHMRWKLLSRWKLSPMLWAGCWSSCQHVVKGQAWETWGTKAPLRLCHLGVTLVERDSSGIFYEYKIFSIFKKIEQKIGTSRRCYVISRIHMWGKSLTWSCLRRELIKASCVGGSFWKLGESFGPPLLGLLSFQNLLRELDDRNYDPSHETQINLCKASLAHSS